MEERIEHLIAKYPDKVHVINTIQMISSLGELNKEMQRLFMYHVNKALKQPCWPVNMRLVVSGDDLVEEAPERPTVQESISGFQRADKERAFIAPIDTDPVASSPSKQIAAPRPPRKASPPKKQSVPKVVPSEPVTEPVTEPESHFFSSTKNYLIKNPTQRTQRTPSGCIRGGKSGRVLTVKMVECPKCKFELANYALKRHLRACDGVSGPYRPYTRKCS